MVGQKLFDLSLCPSMIAICFQARQLYTDGGIVGSQTNLHSVLHEAPDGLEPMTCGKSLF